MNSKEPVLDPKNDAYSFSSFLVHGTDLEPSYSNSIPNHVSLKTKTGHRLWLFGPNLAILNLRGAVSYQLCFLKYPVAQVY